jgi:predicted ATPase
VLQRVLSPVLVGRQEELSQLEDALLSANRGDGRFVLVAGEAGIGKTRLATELTRRARKLGYDVLWGSCSEAELALPYLPFVEAVGNRLAEEDTAALRDALGPTAGELAQLFPRLADGPPTAPAGDPGQAKLRLFESVVTLPELWARDRGLLLVLDDVHWADGSTRELLDYAARRLVRSRMMLLATYRSDELDRQHPLTRTVQAWRKAGLADTVAVTAMTPTDVAEMIAAILNTEEVGADLAAFVGARAEGNPFVLEEMLREALDRGEIVPTDAGWQRGAVETLRMPETVREAVLLRLGRLDPERVEVLRAAAVLGRSFDYGLLAAVAGADDESSSHPSSPRSRSSSWRRKRRRATAIGGGTRSRKRRSRATRSSRSGSGSIPGRRTPCVPGAEARWPSHATCWEPGGRRRRSRRACAPPRRPSARWPSRRRPSSWSASFPTSRTHTSAQPSSPAWAISAG